MKKVGRDVVVKSSGSGKKTSSGDDVEVSSPSSAAVNVIHVSHSVSPPSCSHNSDLNFLLLFWS
jgi:hypothetical protein